MRYLSLASPVRTALALTVFSCLAMAGMSPDSLTAMLPSGGSISETKTVTISKVIPEADIIFAFDLTGSMWDEIDVAKTRAAEIMTGVGGLVTDPHFAVVSFMDYPHYYGDPEDNGGYDADYGDAAWGDYAYLLGQALTDDTTAVGNAINALALGSGADGPQDYARICYESYADENLGYRAGAKKILILFGDDIPHDTDVFAGLVGYPTVSTGRDPGRDELINTGDDLDLQTVLGDMASNNVTLLSVHSGGYNAAWEYWSGLTGGASYDLTNADDIPAAIASLIEAEGAHLDLLTLAVDPPESAAWLTSVSPASYTDIDIEDEDEEFDFDITLTVPAGTEPGLYTFKVVALGDGTNYGEQAVEIRVNNPPDCSGAAPSIATLWPPDHRQVDVTVNGVTDPDGDSVTITIDGITQDEPVNGLGDGDTDPDGGGLTTSTAWVRAERGGKGNGRVYVIAFTATDEWGATCEGTVKVSVPPSQKKGVTAIDDGQNYDSTVD